MPKTASTKKKNTSLSYFDITKESWQITKKNAGKVALIILLFAFAPQLPSIIGDIFRQDAQALAMLFELASFVLSIITSIALIRALLRVIDKKKVEYKKEFEASLSLAVNYFLASVLYGVVVLVGMIFLILPGIYFALKYSYFAYFIAEEEMGPLDSFKASAKLTDGVKLRLVGFGLFLGLMNLIGLFLLGVGLFVTVPVSLVAQGVMYRRLQAKTA